MFVGFDFQKFVVHVTPLLLYMRGRLHWSGPSYVKGTKNKKQIIPKMAHNYNYYFITHEQLDNTQSTWFNTIHKPFFDLNLQNLPNRIGWVGFDDYGSNWETAASLFQLIQCQWIKFF